MPKSSSTKGDSGNSEKSEETEFGGKKVRPVDQPANKRRKHSASFVKCPGFEFPPDEEDSGKQPQRE